MMAVQMIATHEAAIECLRPAIVADGSYNGMEVYLKHAERLLSIYTRQTAVLDKHRSREARRKERAVRESQDEGRQDTTTEALISEPPEGDRPTDPGRRQTGLSAPSPSPVRDRRIVAGR